MLQPNQEYFWRPYCCIPYIIAHKLSNSAASAQETGYTQSEFELPACLICTLFPTALRQHDHTIYLGAFIQSQHQPTACNMDANK